MVVFILTALCLAVGFVGGQEEQFSFEDYDFYFHDDYNLLLTTDAKNCYFTSVRDTAVLETSLHTHKEAVEKFVLLSILNREHLQLSTLAEMRDRYQDRLADYHCLNKAIFRLDIDINEIKANEDHSLLLDSLDFIWKLLTGH